MQKWEYWMLELSITDRWGSKRQQAEIDKFMQILNSAGENGWEMIQYESIPITGGFSNNIKGYAYLLFFKRPQVE